MPRHRVPTRLLKLKGSFREDRHGNRGDELEPEIGFPNPPGWLSAEAKREWRRLQSDSRYAAAICRVDRAMLATYCQLWGQFVRGEQPNTTEGAPRFFPMQTSRVALMATLASRLGLNPADRSRVTVLPRPKNPNPFDELRDSQPRRGR
jgi:P27 family predicted phage terminase small subunit